MSSFNAALFSSRWQQSNSVYTFFFNLRINEIKMQNTAIFSVFDGGLFIVHAKQWILSLDEMNSSFRFHDYFLLCFIIYRYNIKTSLVVSITYTQIIETQRTCHWILRPEKKGPIRYSMCGFILAHVCIYIEMHVRVNIWTSLFSVYISVSHIENRENSQMWVMII